MLQNECGTRKIVEANLKLILVQTGFLSFLLDVATHIVVLIVPCHIPLSHYSHTAGSELHYYTHCIIQTVKTSRPRMKW